MAEDATPDVAEHAVDDAGSGTPPEDEQAEKESGKETPSKAGDEEPDEGSAAWKALDKKYAHIKDEDARRALIGREYWEKTNYATRLREENEELKRRLEAREKPAPKDEKPAEPPADLKRIDDRIEALISEDKTLASKQDAQVEKLTKISSELAVVEHELSKLEPDDLVNKRLLTRDKAALEDRREAARERYQELFESRKKLRVIADDLDEKRQWTARLIQENQKQEESEREALARFNKEFPERVASISTSLAKEMKVPEELREDFADDVKARLALTLHRMEEDGVVNVDVPAIMRRHAEKWLKSHDLAKRIDFKEVSEEKRAVSATRPSSAPAGQKKPAAPVPVTALGLQDQSDSMARARKILASKGL